MSQQYTDGWHCDTGQTRRARAWECSCCDEPQSYCGHWCRDHGQRMDASGHIVRGRRRRVCCSCFDHLNGQCRECTAVTDRSEMCPHHIKALAEYALQRELRKIEEHEAKRDCE